MLFRPIPQLFTRIIEKAAKTNIHDINNQQFLYDIAKTAIEAIKGLGVF
jgi:hypothetical protein